MHFYYLKDNGEIQKQIINKKNFLNKELTNKVFFINSKPKLNCLTEILFAYFSSGKAILIDEHNKTYCEELKKLKIKNINELKKPYNTIFDDKNFSFINHTSGSTGNSTSVLKTKENLINEINSIFLLIEKFNIKKIIITVPFIHNYGLIFGIILPILKNIDIIFKEHFLPNDLINIIEKNTMVVTTPPYIKALNLLNSKKNLSESLFVSSTAPLDIKNVSTFNKKFNCNIMQIFGSSETGAIGYKFNDQELWTPLKNVNISTNKNSELLVKSPFTSEIIYNNKIFINTNYSLQTADYIELNNKDFKLFGRSSQLIKHAGKRYSTLLIEEILEKEKNIKKALIYVERDNKKIKDEILNITLETDKKILKKDINKILLKELSNIKFNIKLNLVEKIKTSSIGKKLKIQ